LLSEVSHTLRLVRVGYVLMREGAFSLADPAQLSPSQRALVRALRLFEKRGAGGAKLAGAFTRLGPTYVKLGQFLATRPDVVGIRNARELETLQDRMPSFPKAVALASIEASLGKPVSALFGEIGEPVAAASVAQVHKAVTLGGETVAVKVLRPGVRERFARDVGAMVYAAHQAERRGGAEARRLRPVESVRGFARSVQLETDLRLEAAALSELHQNAGADKDFRVPSVDWERTGRDVLTTEWIDGVPVANIAALDAAGHDRKRLAVIAMQSFLRHALRDGFFHADMHQGNLFVDAEGRLVAVDCGIMGRLGLNERRVLAEILYGFIKRDYRRVAEVHFEAGYVPAHHSVDEFAQAIRAIGEPIHDRPASEISMARLLTLLFEITAIFDMQTRTELVLLQKTMIVVEGVSRGLDPDFDMWSASEPVLREWIETNLGPLGKLHEMGTGARQALTTAARLPEMANRADALLRELERQAAAGFALSPQSIEAIGRAEARRNRWGNLALWALVALAAYTVLS
jgi:ubiquinone biosynthesis protein